MKKIIAIFLLVSMIFGMTACKTNSEDPTEEQTDPTAESTSTNPITTSTTETITEKEYSSAPFYTTVPFDRDKLPKYIPGSIKLDDMIDSDFNFKPTKRRVYYQAYLGELFPVGTSEDIFKDLDKFEEPTEMAVVTVIKYGNIPREVFERVIKRMEEKYISWGANMMLEDNELPNADIIYTFDNDIINEYYRRK